MATSLQLFNKTDLQAVMKAGRWSSGGIFTSFYLRDLCLQADSIRKTGPVVAPGEIVEISWRTCGCVSWRTHLDFRQVKSLSVGSLIMVFPEPTLAVALPFLSYSGFIRNII